MGFNDSKKTPCMGCNNRYVGCHAECDTYREYAAREKALKAEYTKYDRVLSASIENIIKTKERNMK